MLRSTMIVAVIGCTFFASTLASMSVDAHVPYLPLNTERERGLPADEPMMKDGWASGWQTGDWSLCSNDDLDKGEVNCTQICTQIDGQMRVGIKYMKKDSTYHETMVYIPASAKVNVSDSDCLTFILNATGDGYVYHTYDKDTSKPPKYTWATSTLRLDFYDGDAWVKLTFSNSTDLGSAGWMQWTIVDVELHINAMKFPTHFPDISPMALDDDMWLSRLANGTDRGWWKTLSTRNFSTYDCHTMMEQDLGNNMSFAMQNMMLTALNFGILSNNATLDPRMCNRDYEKDDGLAVVIGSVQTGFVMITLVIYLVYLSKRGPVKVPDWIIEPSMRNAQVKPITEETLDRKMSQVSGSSLPQKRSGAPADDKY